MNSTYTIHKDKATTRGQKVLLWTFQDNVNFYVRACAFHIIFYISPLLPSKENKTYFNLLHQHQQVKVALRKPHTNKYTYNTTWKNPSACILRVRKPRTILSGGLRLKTRLLQRMWWKEEHQPRALSHSAVPRGVSASSLCSRISSFWARTAMFSISFSICATHKSNLSDTCAKSLHSAHTLWYS